MTKVKISTDSTADIPVSLREELNISVLPITIIVDNKEYQDGFDITPQEIYEILDKSDKLPTTAQIVPFLYTESFENTWKDGYTDLIHICINSKGSASWQGAVRTKEQFYEEHPEAKDNFKIHIIDSKTYSMGYGCAAIEAARMAVKNMPVDDILAGIKDWLDNAKPMFVPLNLKCVKKSGRVSAAAAFVGDAIGIKPVITFENGESKIVSKIRGEGKVVNGLLEMVKKDRKPGTPYFVIYGNNETQYKKLREACLETFEQPTEFDYSVGCVISINTGPNMIGIIYRT